MRYDLSGSWGSRSWFVSTFARLSRSTRRIAEVVLEPLAARGVAQHPQRIRLDLADALAGDLELAAHLLQRAAAAVT